jgi:hypothetical protein
VRAVDRRRHPAAAPQHHLRRERHGGLAEGRLRDRAHGLRGSRHAGRAPIPHRDVGGALGARRRPRRARSTRTSRTR